MPTTSRYDKYDSRAGGFRGILAAAWPASDVGKLYGVSIDGTGKVAKGGAATAVVGVVVINEAKNAGDTVDVMTHGEIADFNFLNDGTTATVVGTVYYADNAAAGAPTATATSNKRIGQRVLDNPDKGRLIVRVVQP